MKTPAAELVTPRRTKTLADIRESMRARDAEVASMPKGAMKSAMLRLSRLIGSREAVRQDHDATSDGRPVSLRRFSPSACSGVRPYD